MNINDVAAEIGAKITAAEIGLRVLPWDADSGVVPGVIFALPTGYRYDLTHGRGSDEYDQPIILLVGKADARSARLALGRYISGTSPTCIKSFVDSSNTNVYTTCDTVRVLEVTDMGAYVSGGVTYLGATLVTHITGKGA